MSLAAVMMPTGPGARVVVRASQQRPEVEGYDVRCPRCRRLLAQGRPGGTFVLKCTKCDSYVRIDGRP